MSAENRLKELGIVLPEPPPPVGNYIGAVRAGDLVFLSGHGPRLADNSSLTGKVPSERGVEAAAEAARLVGLNMLASLRAEIGTLDAVARFVKVLGLVNADPDFREHPKVINGFSDLMVEIFGDSGRCARSAMGMGSLPFQISVEIEAVVALNP